LIQPEHGTHKVVWWDPSKLTLDVDADVGIRQKEILAEDGGKSLAAYREWEKSRIATLAASAVPQFDVFLASQAADSPPSPVKVATVLASAAENRPRGKRFGTLVHAAMRDVDLDAKPGFIAKVVEMNARSLGAPPEEIEAARAAVQAALAHPLLARARASQRLHREYPVTLNLGDGRLIEGIIDLAFIENDEWVIVDFKTDADLEEPRASYERQLQWYAYALTRLTGKPAHAFLLGV
jgi:ATP-dependent exoDNAse (exonuclease V) beta subunit